MSSGLDELSKYSVASYPSSQWKSCIFANPSSAKTSIFHEKVNSMAADNLAPRPCAARSSTAMALVLQDKQVLVFHKVGIQWPVTSQSWEMIENSNMFLCFLNYIQHDRVKCTFLIINFQLSTAYLPVIYWWNSETSRELLLIRMAWDLISLT